MGVVLINNFIVCFIILLLYIKVSRQENFLTPFDCNKVYVFYSDESNQNMLAEISVFNVKSCFACLL